jgi:HD superfamily phosphodiesterase
MAAASSALLADIANQLKKLDKLDLIEQELSKLTTEFSGMSQKVKYLELVQQDLVTGVSHQEEER